MIKLKVILAAAAVAGTAPLSTAAAQVVEVQAAVEATLAAWNAGDLAGVAAHYAEETRGFFLDGGVLLRGFNLPALQAAYAAGFRASFTARDVDVRVLGNVAVAAAYVDGSLTLPGGEAKEGTWRYTETRVNEDGRWRIVQYHFSQLKTPAGR